MNEPNSANGGTSTADEQGLQTRLETAERERDQYLEQLKRSRADFDNYQKRALRDMQEERRYSHTPLARDLLAAFDNLDRATAAAKQAGESGPLVQGVAMVQGQWLDALKRHGIQRIDALHQAFDPNLHQAVMQQPTADHAPGTVLQVLQQGFTIHDRVLRPASVVVAAAPEGTG